MEKISVIVPIYNVKPYLEKCINSIINQSYKNLEIILVDDGSTDGSELLVDLFSKKDKRIKVIHQVNQGLSAARNSGMKIASSKYYSFIDSDDYIEENFIEVLYNNLIENDADMSVCRYYSDKQENVNKSVITVDKVTAIKKFINCDGVYGVVAWNKLYKKELFDDNYFFEGKNYEDIYPIIMATSRCKRVVLCNLELYYYNSNRALSICNLEFNNKEYDRLYSLLKIEPLFKMELKDIKNQFNIYEILNNLFICDKLLKIGDNNNEFINNTKELIKNNIFKIIFTNYNVRRKIQLFYFLLNTKSYQNYLYNHFKVESCDLVSVIVPLYNEKNYLKKCIDSIINQTYKNIEIIIIDDGSTDGSSKIADDLQKKDKRIKVYHKQNNGSSSTRNEGIKRSKGNYLCFVDSDDYIHEKFVESLINNLVTTSSSISCCSYNFNEKSNPFKETIKVLDSKETLKKMINYDYNVGLGCTNKLFKRALFTNNKFPNYGCNEDLFIVGKLISEAKRTVINNMPYYYYIRRNNTLSHKMDKSEYKRIEIINDLEQLINKQYKDISKQMILYKITNYLAIYNKLVVNDLTDLELEIKIKKTIKSNIKNIIFIRYNFKRKCQMLLFIFNEKLYSMIYLLIQKKKFSKKNNNNNNFML